MIMEEYKVGDKVRIIHRDKNEWEYPFTFIDNMTEFEGKECTISNIRKSEEPKCAINGDYHEYTLDGGDGYVWHSSMFAKVKEVKITNTSIINIKSTSTIKIIL